MRILITLPLLSFDIDGHLNIGRVPRIKRYRLFVSFLLYFPHLSSNHKKL